MQFVRFSSIVGIPHDEHVTHFDPLLDGYRLRHLALRNRVVSTSHEPAYTEDGMPKDRYRLYHLEKARGGVGLTMIGGSAVVSPDSPPAFGNMLLYKDEVVPWLARLADATDGASRLHLSRPLPRAGQWPAGCSASIALPGVFPPTGPEAAPTLVRTWYSRPPC